MYSRLRYLLKKSHYSRSLFSVGTTKSSFFVTQVYQLSSLSFSLLSGTYQKSLENFEEIIFDSLSNDNEKIAINKFYQVLKERGLALDDPRLQESVEKLNQLKLDKENSNEEPEIGKQQFKECIRGNIVLIAKALTNKFIIPEFQTFCQEIDCLYNNAKQLQVGKEEGKVADYIPQLARADPSNWAVSLCTVDGQRHSVGNSDIPFTLQSCNKALSYAIASSELGPEEIHNYVGREPSGRKFDALTLNDEKKPHNPMINAGAMLLASLIKSDDNPADRFDFMLQHYTRCAGGKHVGFNNSVYLSEKETGFRNMALAYYMKDHQCYKEPVDIKEIINFYFQLCSIEVISETVAVMAATLANGGICPITGEKVFKPTAVRNTLSLMHSCGMYNYSGEFAFTVGLPVKSGVSGCILTVVPNVLGIATWSPVLDRYGNSVRGVKFLEDLVEKYNFHHYDNLKHTTQKVDPRIVEAESKAKKVMKVLFGAYQGDCSALRGYALQGADMEVVDYDGRTALHIAASEGHVEVVDFLINKCKVKIDPKDRWNNTPLDDAGREKHEAVIKIIETHHTKNP